MNSSDLWLRLRALFHRKRADHDLQDELDFHIQMLTRKNQSPGIDSDEARRQALVKFGGLSRVDALQNWALSREGSNPSPEDLQRIKGT